MLYAVIRYLLLVSRGGLVGSVEIDIYAETLRQLVGKLPPPSMSRPQDISHSKYSISRSCPRHFGTSVCVYCLHVRVNMTR